VPTMPSQSRDQAADYAADYAGGLDRVTVPEAAERLGISENALRKRVQRDTVQWDRDDDGRVFVYLPPAGPPAGTDQATGQADGHAGGYAADQASDHPVAPVELVESLQEQLGYLRGALETRDKELAEMRRLLAGALERIPALEAPQDTPTNNASSEPRETSVRPSEEQGEGTGPTNDQDAQRPSWWRRFFGFE
jgi:hypothetical protein